MLRIFGDFETFYDSDYTLTQLSPVEYILDRRWETLGCAVAMEKETPFWLPRDHIADWLRSINEPYVFISHNALFDACILSYRYNIHPNVMLCTLSMSRAVLLHEIKNGRVSLKAVLAHLGLPEKGEFIGQMRGKRYADLEQLGMLPRAIEYALGDVEGCRNIFFHLCTQLNGSEAHNIDRIIRMATKPVLQLDMDQLHRYLIEVQAKRTELLSRVTVDRNTLMSNIKFAEALREHGIEPPLKMSPRTGNETYAFSRTDSEFMELLEHPDEDVVALVAARLGIKSTIEESRTQRFINIGAATHATFGTALIPVPLKYSGAHTHRLSGDWKLNMQNLSARKSKEIRKSIVAPLGWLIVAVDASQIEARLTAWLAGQMDLLLQFANGEDTYRIFASEIFREILEAITKVQRFIGKQCILGLGFGMSARKLYFTIRTLAREQGIDVSYITEQDCAMWVLYYRRRFTMITRMWDVLGMLLQQMSMGLADGQRIGPCVVEGTTVIFPSGLRLYYDELQNVNGEWYFRFGQYWKKIYGGKTLENVVQGLDRQHVMDANDRTERRAKQAGLTDVRLLLNVHDENVYCVPQDEAITLASIAHQEMCRNTEYFVGLPLAAEVKIGSNFGEMEEVKL